MKKLFLMMAMVFALNTVAAQVTREGNTFVATKTTKAKTESQKTQFTYKDSKGVEHPIFVSKSGSCYINKTSKSGKDYRQYLGAEVSSQVCKELGIKYTPKSK